MCLCRKQCIELEQQFDFLKDLVATVPDMQGEGDENHAEGAERIPRRLHTHTHTCTLPVALTEVLRSISMSDGIRPCIKK